MVGVRGNSPSMPSQRRKEKRFSFSLGVTKWVLIACSSRNKKRCEVIGYESTRLDCALLYRLTDFLIRITFGIPLSPHSLDSLDIGLSEENPIGRVPDSQILNCTDTKCVIINIIFECTIKIVAACMYVHNYISRGKTSISHICEAKREFHLQRETQGSSNYQSLETPHKHVYI